MRYPATKMVTDAAAAAAAAGGGCLYSR